MKRYIIIIAILFIALLSTSSSYSYDNYISDYFPLNVGNKWVMKLYTGETQTWTIVKKDSKTKEYLVEMNLGQISKDSDFGENKINRILKIEGNTLIMTDYWGTESVLLKPPFDLYSSWKDRSGNSYRIIEISRKSITVLAGTFNDYIVVEKYNEKAQKYVMYYYVKNVGQVLATYKNQIDGKIYELQSYKLSNNDERYVEKADEEDDSYIETKPKKKIVRKKEEVREDYEEYKLDDENDYRRYYAPENYKFMSSVSRLLSYRDCLIGRKISIRLQYRYASDCCPYVVFCDQYGRHISVHFGKYYVEKDERYQFVKYQWYIIKGIFTDQNSEHPYPHIDLVTAEPIIYKSYDE